MVLQQRYGCMCGADCGETRAMGFPLLLGRVRANTRSAAATRIHSSFSILHTGSNWIQRNETEQFC